MSLAVAPLQNNIILAQEINKNVKDELASHYLRCTINEKSNGTQDAFSGAINNKSIHLGQYWHA